ncbi:MAG: SdrD B-like domain-containing protein [Chlamydiota bacterium]|nr:SdrD B-like domain-containing protein [Chlamydiota bacterium]
MVKLRLIILEDRIVFDGAIAHDVAAIPTPPPPQVEVTDTNVIVISDDVADSDVLAAAANDNSIVVVYDYENDSLSDINAQIYQALDGKKADNIAFATEGTSGAFSLTDDHEVNSDTIDEQSGNSEMLAFWDSISNMVMPGGQIDLLGCNLGLMAEGLEFLNDFSEMINDQGTSIIVNASSDRTGSELLGGDWVLEYSSEDNTQPVNLNERYFTESSLNDWNNVLVTPDVIISPTSGLITTEAGGTDTFDIVLSTQPNSIVYIYLYVNDASEGELDSTFQAFTPSNWNIQITFTVTGLDDGLNDGNISYNISFNMGLLTDPDYLYLKPDDLVVINQDNEPSGNAEVSTQIWRDLNGNGTRDTNDPFVAGLSVSIYDANTNNLVNTLISDTNGEVHFTNLPDGDYYLQWEIPINHSLASYAVSGGIASNFDSDANPTLSTPEFGQSNNFSLGVFESKTVIDMGLLFQTPDATGEVGDYVWDDSNADGLQTGEDGVSDVEVVLYGIQDFGMGTVTSALRTTTTNSLGNYQFSGVADSDNKIVGDKPDVLFLIDISDNAKFIFPGSLKGPNAGDFNNDGRLYTYLDHELFALAELTQHLINIKAFGIDSEIGIIVYADDSVNLNMNINTHDLTKLFDISAPAVGTQLTIAADTDANGNNIPDVIEILKKIALNYVDIGLGRSYYEALGNAIDTYTFLGTAPGNGNMFFLSVGAPTTSSNISDRVQILNDLEVNITAVAVRYSLPVSYLQPIDPDAFNINNFSEIRFLFTNELTPGAQPYHYYYVEFVKPNDAEFTLKDVGIDDTIDSDADTGTGRTDAFSIASGETNISLDAGLIFNPIISIDNVSIVEGGQLQFTVSLNRPSLLPVTVDIVTSDGTATLADNDYTDTPLTTLTFSPLATSLTVTVQTTNDTKYELNETLFVNLSNPNNAIIIDNQGEGTILNDDVAPTITIIDNNGALPGETQTLEGGPGDNNVLTFIVELSNPSFEDITFEFSSLDGTATLTNNDYVGPPPPYPTVTIAAGTTSATFNIPVVGDTTIEANESLTAIISVVSGQTSNTSASADGIIIDDEIIVPQIIITEDPFVKERLNEFYITKLPDYIFDYDKSGSLEGFFSEDYWEVSLSSILPDLPPIYVSDFHYVYIGENREPVIFLNLTTQPKTDINLTIDIKNAEGEVIDTISLTFKEEEWEKPQTLFLKDYLPLLVEGIINVDFRPIESDDPDFDKYDHENIIIVKPE